MAMGRGDVRLQVNGEIQVISSVYYIPDLKNNLLSIGQIQEKGMTIVIKNGACTLYHPKFGRVMQCKMASNQMFMITASVIASTAEVFLETTKEDRTYL